MNCQTLLWLQYHFHWKCNSFVHSNNVSEIKYNTKRGLKCFTVLANWRLLKLVCPWWWIHASLHDECFSRFWYFSFITQGSKGRGNKALYRKETAFPVSKSKGAWLVFIRTTMLSFTLGTKTEGPSGNGLNRNKIAIIAWLEHVNI